MSDVRLVPPTDDDLWWRPRSARAESMRRDLLRIVTSAIDAAAPAPLVANALTTEPVDADSVLILAVGKAAVPMAKSALDVLAGRRVRGIVVAPEATGSASAERDPDVAPLELLRGGHPLPNAASFAAGQRIAGIARAAGENDVVLLLLSGGASALMALPAGDVTTEDYAALTALLLRSGADIQRLNTVRRHIDLLKGGRLAAFAHPARVRALILSDVVGDALHTIASGPVTPDSTTFADAIAALHAVHAWAGTPERVRRHLERGAAGEYDETLKPGDARLAHVNVQIVGNNALALAGAAHAASAVGYTPVVLDAPITGIAREAGRAFGERARAAALDAGRRMAIIGGGETTVHVSGGGRGGRNQELALAAAMEIAGTGNVLVASFGTDGIDGSTSVAGAAADGESVARAAERHVSASAYLDDNDAFGFFGSLHDLILTGPTGTNVLDVQIALIETD